MNQSTGLLSCTPCPPGLYSIQQGAMHDFKLDPFSCSTCPFGGNCSGAATLKALLNFWGRQTSSTQVEFLQCPPHYCCGSSTGCLWQTDDACQGKRNISIPLCGGCKRGYSQAIDSTSCIINSKCGLTHSARYIALQLLYWLMFDLYALYQARFQPLCQMLPRWVRPDPRNSGAVSAVIFFYQMAALVVPDGYSVLYQKAANTLSYIGQVLSLQHPPPPGATDAGNSASYGSCVVQGMDARHSMLWALFNPLLLLLLLPVVVKGIGQLSSLSAS